jgi:hypothetical protein
MERDGREVGPAVLLFGAVSSQLSAISKAKAYGIRLAPPDGILGIGFTES